ncbi:Ferric enterobactin transport system permease protein fepG [Serratia quinivorans]|uniref:iron-enterobactin ABC transporter permease n=1 Tax=Serratia quinivorans TaxID=137545 RepID=UPI0021774C5E|nr:iron-enterobactin ABC transporter permease [Serratia quinivorans]CAI1514740.1 Ferric enterobactin transport system permease protein fepG [Serratia quinivorans]CAI1752782.1 Ferric enterobactin transport system permease protein fepG [Serratia quinivorans]
MSTSAARLMTIHKMRALSRPTLTALLLLLAALALAIYALGSGALSLTATQVIDALRGEGPANLAVIVTQWRLPRVVMALLLGAALGLSGAIFQSILRNPLGSPDVIGFNTGAYSGVLVAIVLFNGGVIGITAGALAGGLLTAALIYLLAWRNGVESFRLIIVGIAVRALLVAGNTWLIISASLESAMTAGLWSAGSLNGINWAKSLPVLAVIALCCLLLLTLTRRMRLLEMGDDTACALGVPVERSRVMLLLIGVTLTAAATAVAGPISFIALVAPQIARRLCANRSVLLLTTLIGALLLLLADVAAQRLFMPYQLPVGVLTVSLGGIYLIWLLIRESRKK